MHLSLRADTRTRKMCSTKCIELSIAILRVVLVKEEVVEDIIRECVTRYERHELVPQLALRINW